MAVTLKIGGDPKKAEEAIARLQAKIQQLEAGSVRAGQRGSTSFERMTGKLAGMAAGAVSATAVIQGITSALRQAEAAADASAQLIQQTVDNVKQLAQLGDLPARRATAQELRQRFGFSRPEAQQFTFAMTSAGMSRRDILEAASLRDIEPDVQSVSRAVQKFRLQFGPEALGGRFQSVANAIFTAAVESELTGGQLGPLAVRSAGIAKELGVRPAELLSAVAVGTQAGAVPEETQTAIRSFMTQLSRDQQRRFEGIGLTAAVRRVQALPEEQRRALLSEVRALEGFSLLSASLPQIEALTARVREATLGAGPDTFIGSRMAAVRADPELTATRRVQIETQRRQIAEEMEGVREIMFDAQRETIRRMLVERGAGAVERFLANRALGLADVLNVAPEQVATFGAELTQNRTPFMPIDRSSAQFQRDMLSIWNAAAETLRSIDGKLSGGGADMQAVGDRNPLNSE